MLDYFDDPDNKTMLADAAAIKQEVARGGVKLIKLSSEAHRALVSHATGEDNAIADRLGVLTLFGVPYEIVPNMIAPVTICRGEISSTPPQPVKPEPVDRFLTIKANSFRQALDSARDE